MMELKTFKHKVLPIKDKLFRFTLRMMGDEDEAKDVVQDALIRVWKHRKELNKLDNVEAWCMRITRNLALDRIKYNKRRFTAALYEVSDVSAGDDDTPYADIERKDMNWKINRLMENLPDKQRSVIQLRDVEGYSYKEIGEIMNIDLNQVKVSLFRARQAVKENIIKINAYGT